MSEISLFKNGGMPAYLKNVQSNLSAATFASSGGGKVISIKGGVWRLIVDGEEVSKNEARAMEFVIVGMSETVGRTYYVGKYEEGKEATPVCWSADGKSPSPKAAEQQANSCDECPKNIKGSGDSGSKACRYIRSLAVVLADDMDGDVYRLNLPAMSIFGSAEDGKMPFDAFRKFMKGVEVPIDCAVTEIRFDTNAAVPKLFFKPVRALTEDEFNVCQAKGASQETKELVTLDFRDGVVTTGQMPAAKAKPALTAKPSLKPKAAEPEETVEDVEQVEAEVVEEPVRKVAARKLGPAGKSPAAIADEWASDDE